MTQGDRRPKYGVEFGTASVDLGKMVARKVESGS